MSFRQPYLEQAAHMLCFIIMMHLLLKQQRSLACCWIDGDALPEKIDTGA